jgi:hypothetical protein
VRREVQSNPGEGQRGPSHYPALLREPREMLCDPPEIVSFDGSRSLSHDSLSVFSSRLNFGRSMPSLANS